MKKTKKTVLSATISAASVVVQLLGTVIPSLELTAAAITGIPLFIIKSELGLTYSLLSYLTVSTLSLLLLPDKIAVLSYIFFFGIYPIFKKDIERLGKVFSWIIKLSLFNLLFSGCIYIGKVVLMVEDPLFSFSILPYIVANFAFVMYDIAMTMFLSLYETKYKNKPYFKRLFNGK